MVTLAAVLDSVHARAPLMQAARARARAVRGDRTTAGTFENPFLMYQVENTPFPGGPPMVGVPVERMTTATLPLAPLYQRGSRVRQAEANVRAADAEARGVSQSLISDAARAYYRVALAQVAVDAADNVSNWLDSLVAYNRSRVQQGALAEADLIRTELERDRARADGSMHAAELARARVALAAYLGEPTARALNLRVAVDDMPLRMPSESVRDADSVSMQEIARRPDVLAGRERLAAGDAGVSLEQRLLLRDVGAVFGVKTMLGMHTMVAGFTLPIPLLDQNRGSRARAKAELEAAAFGAEAAQREARADIIGAEEAARILTVRATALAVRDSAGNDIAYLQRANSARAIALGAFREGAVSLLQVLDAARAWSDARVTYFRTLFAQHEAVISLLIARGDELPTTLPLLMPANTRGSTR